jgi:L-asparagine oxygenase
MALAATDRSKVDHPLPTLAPAAFRLPVPAGSPLDEGFVAAAGDAARALPAAVQAALAAFRTDPGPDGALLLRGLPVGDVGETPAHPGAPTGKDRASELTLLAVARLLGEPIGYVQEHGGGLVQDIVPDRAHEGRQLSTSSSVTLEWHTETAFHPHKPRYLLLLCLRGDPAARTMLCSISLVLPHLDAATIATLREPRFRTRPDASFLDEGAVGELGPPMAVVTGVDAGLTFTYDEDLMVGTDTEAQAALDRLGRAVRTHAAAVVLEAGDLLVIDNHRVVHARSPFPARFDGRDRWLQRTFVVSDLAASAGARTGRIITTRF